MPLTIGPYHFWVDDSTVVSQASTHSRCTAFQGVTVTTSIQLYGILFLGKCHAAQNHSWAFVWNITVSVFFFSFWILCNNSGLNLLSCYHLYRFKSYSIYEQFLSYHWFAIGRFCYLGLQAVKMVVFLLLTSIYPSLEANPRAYKVGVKVQECLLISIKFFNN